MSRIFSILLLLSTTYSIAQINFTPNTIDDNYQRSAYSWVVDMDGDGDQDVIATAFFGNELAWYENDGNQEFTKHSIDNNFDGAWWFLSGDFDGDNDIDLWVNASNLGEYYLFINDGSQNFTKTSIQSFLGVDSATPRDFDGDGDTDFIHFDNVQNEITWLENSGSANYTSHTIPIDLSNVDIIGYVDLDGDLDMDVLLWNNSLNQHFWYENNNTTSFISHNTTLTYDTGDYYFFSYHNVLDVDKDGDLDLVYNSIANNYTAWYENDGSQVYTRHIIDSTILAPYHISAADLDNDNDIDIVVSAYNDDEMVWYENDGSQGFSKKEVSGTVDGPIGHFIMDVDNDSDLDVVMNGYLAHNLLWFESDITSKNIDNHAYKDPLLGNHNYVYTMAPQKEMTSIDSTTVKINSDLIESVGYFDGIGRPMQQIAVRAGGKGEDLITPLEYDDLGRRIKEFLPFAESSNIGEKLRPTIDLNGFYKLKYADDFANTPTIDINPYSEMVYEASPLNRVMEQGAPGESWKVDQNSNTDHTIKFDYLSNSATDSVRLFEVTFIDPSNTEAPSLVENSNYTIDELYKTVTKDENWQPGQTYLNDRTTEEFKDKQGMVLLKRTYNLNVAHDTYYVYDDFKNLTFVIPPKAADIQTIDQGVLDNLCYQYKYDYRNRLIEKKIPGKGIESIVYDNLDRPVLTQDANLLAEGKWLFTKYDALGRVVYTGKFSDTRSRILNQTDFNNKATVQDNYEERTSGGFESTDYTNADFPSTGLEILTVNYYDDYAFELDGGVDPGTVFEISTASNVKSLATGSKVKVLDTSDWITTVTYYDEKARPIYVYSKNDFLNTTDIVKSDLDFVGRVLRTRTSHTYGTEAELVTLDTFTYDQAGRLLKQVQCIGGFDLDDDCAKNGAEGLEDTLVTTESVNPGTSKSIEATGAIILKPGFIAKPIAGQTVEVKTSTATISGVQIELIAENTYDELGQLVIKKVGNVESTPLQNIAYNYNVRGWLNSINNETGSNSVLGLGADDLFGFQINYDKPSTNSGVDALFNGNISQTLWKTTNTDNSQKSYAYRYDALNRIKHANDFKDNVVQNKYNLAIAGYDKNGNILDLIRQGQIGENPDLSTGTDLGTMDNLTYVYDSGNKLLSVTESTNASTTYGFKDGNTSGDDYTYDVNGNMISDANKGITSITYNHLNLPSLIDFGGGNKIEYFYDASGIKNKKIVTEGSSLNTTEYAGNYIYDDGSLQFFSHAEGYVTPSTNNDFTYVYQYKDHLGNIRLSYTDISTNEIPVLEIIEENNYYPFGLKHKGYNSTVGAGGNSVAQKRKFGGNELQDELRLEWYDITARNYDPALGRWMNLDPLAEQMRRHSPYNYAFNNPIYFIDPDGMAPQGFGGIVKFAETPGPNDEEEGEDCCNGVGATIRAFFNSTFGFGNKDINEAEDAGVDAGVIKKLRDKDQKAADTRDEILQALLDSFETADILGAQTLAISLMDGDVNMSDGINILSTLPVGKVFKLGKGLKLASPGLKKIFQNGSGNVLNNSIISLRKTLTNNGFTQTLTKNKKGYLFINKTTKEEVRIMRRNGQWDLRVRNSFGNYLDNTGNVGKPISTHGLNIKSK